MQFHGHLSRRDVAQMMRAADILVLPSLWETQGCVLLEATSSGLPAVASRVGGTPEVVNPSNGELVEPDSETALVDGIVRVIEGGIVTTRRPCITGARPLRLRGSRPRVERRLRERDRVGYTRRPVALVFVACLVRVGEQS